MLLALLVDDVALLPQALAAFNGFLQSRVDPPELLLPDGQRGADLIQFKRQALYHVLSRASVDGFGQVLVGTLDLLEVSGDLLVRLLQL
jgi:hypothetical protein